MNPLLGLSGSWTQKFTGLKWWLREKQSNDSKIFLMKRSNKNVLRAISLSMTSFCIWMLPRGGVTSLLQWHLLHCKEHLQKRFWWFPFFVSCVKESKNNFLIFTLVENNIPRSRPYLQLSGRAMTSEERGSKVLVKRRLWSHWALIGYCKDKNFYNIL